MRRVLAALILLLVTSPAAAHEAGLSFLSGEVRGDTVVAALDAPVVDYAQALRLDANGDGRLEQSDLEAGEAGLRRWLFGSLRFVANGRPCEGESIRYTLQADALLSLEGTWKCEGEIHVLDLASRVLDTFGADHSTFVRLARNEVAHQALLTDSASSISFDFGAPESAWSAAGRFLVLGVEHIFLGIDHVLFVLALLLLGGSLKRIIGVATAFTVAHSITLSIAALDLLVLPSAFVESMIALSIGWVAVENYVLAAPRTEARAEPFSLRWRWLLTFAFGLLHGFGFAGVLSDLGLPPDHRAVTLATFNLGVELGQVAIIAVAWPFLHRATRTHWYRPHAVRFASVSMFAVAVYWFVERAFG